jgi:hypothetical protein
VLRIFLTFSILRLDKKVNSLDVQLGEFPTSAKQASKTVNNEIQVREQNH